MKKFLLSAILCGVVALSFSACSSEPEKLVDMKREVEKIKDEMVNCKESDEADKCFKDSLDKVDNIAEKMKEIWKTLSEEEKELTKELIKKEGLESTGMDSNIIY